MLKVEETKSGKLIVRCTDCGHSVDIDYDENTDEVKLTNQYTKPNEEEKIEKNKSPKAKLFGRK